MNKKYIYSVLAILALMVSIQSCEIVPDPGFDGQIRGQVLDGQGNPVYSDVLSNTIIINALGDGDVAPIIIRVDGTGSFAYTKLYPKKHTLSISGPVYVDGSNSTVLDFSSGNSIEQNFVVEPFITLNLQQKGSPTANSVTVTYSLKGNRGKQISKREIYCSTSPYPTSKIGSGPFYQTVTKSATTDSGEAVITGLQSGTKYYIRMGANGKTGSVNDLMNYSNQVIITTP